MKAITTLEELDALDGDAMLDGYRAGLGFVQINYMRKDQAYWHGYLNGQVDRGLAPISPEQVTLARLAVERGDFAAIFGGKN
jgi:hypothetical protein